MFGWENNGCTLQELFYTPGQTARDPRLTLLLCFDV